MSVLAEPARRELAYRVRSAFAGLSWIGLAAFLAGVIALANALDPKLGLVVALALVFGGIVTQRPSLLLPLAAATVFVESLSFSGQPVTRLVAPAALLLTVAELLRGTIRIRPAAPLAFTAVYVAWGVASGVWSVKIEGTSFIVQSLAIALVYLLAFAALLNTEAELRRLLYVLVFSGAFMGGLSVLAFSGMFGPDGDIIPGHLVLLQAGRSQGGVGDPDFFAGMQLVCVPLALVLGSHAQSAKARIAVYAATLTLLASVFTSLSRGAYLAFIVLAVGLLASRPEKVFRTRGGKAAALLVLAVGMVAFFSRPYLRAEVVGRAESIYAPQDRNEASGSGRTNLWKAAAKTAAENPVLGIGWGTFPYISQELIFHTPGIDLEVLQIREEGNNFVAHNTYLGMAAELGFTGVALLLGLLVSTGVMLRRLSNRALAVGADFVGGVAHALLIGLCTWSIVIVFLSAETARMFWMIIGLTLALPKLLPDQARPRPEPSERAKVEWRPPLPALRSPAPATASVAGPRRPGRSAPPLLPGRERSGAPPATDRVPAEPAPSLFERAPAEPVREATAAAAPLAAPEPAPSDEAPRRRSRDLLVRIGAVVGLLYALGLLALVLLR